MQRGGLEGRRSKRWQTRQWVSPEVNVERNPPGFGSRLTMHRIDLLLLSISRSRRVRVDRLGNRVIWFPRLTVLPEFRIRIESLIFCETRMRRSLKGRRGGSIFIAANVPNPGARLDRSDCLLSSAAKGRYPPIYLGCVNRQLNFGSCRKREGETQRKWGGSLLPRDTLGKGVSLVQHPT